ncbi:hypothetical protein [Pseudomonas sp. B329]|uniref:hypothetical protein n=1 Tax=Pseudomonas sp. B329 TaxID=1553459 RepID=UPI0020057BDC|nr:hypothetical protein [Pseudomonas sp. B329]
MVGLTVVVLNGAGRTVQWLPALPPSTAPANIATTAPATSIALQTYSQTWEKPLFNAQRRPDPPPQHSREKTPVALKGLTLTGVIASGKVRKAFFKTEDGQQLSALEHQSLPNGWLVDQVQPLHVSLIQGSEIQILTLQLLKIPQNSPAPSPSSDTFKDRTL